MDETRLFFLSDGSIDRVTYEALSAIAGAYGLSAEGLSAYRAALPGASAGELFSAIQTDWYWRIPAVRMADAHAMTTRASTYMYEFAWRSPQFGGRLGAAHSVEIPFVFDTLGLGTEPLLGPHPPQSLATAMHRAWVAFAALGDCGWPNTISPAGQRCASIQYLKLLTILLARSSRCGNAFNSSRLKLLMHWTDSPPRKGLLSFRFAVIRPDRPEIVSMARCRPAPPRTPSGTTSAGSVAGR